MPQPSPRVAVSTYFVLAGFISGSWIARIPSISGNLDLSTSRLGLLLLLLGIGSVLAFQVVGRLITAFGSARVTFCFGLALAFTPVAMAIAPTPALLGLALFTYGATTGATSVAMNAQGVEVERLLHKTIMGSLHGYFSLGALAGAAGSAAASAVGIDLLPHFAIVTIVTLVLGLWANLGQIPDHTAAQTHGQSPREANAARSLRIPLTPRPLRMLGVIAFCGGIGEGAMADWSALFIHDELDGSESMAAVGFAAFSFAMLAGRFAGDRIVDTFGASRTVRAGGCIAVIGLLIGLLPGFVSTAIAGFGILGLGLSVIIPIVYSTAGATPGIPSGTAVAAVATIGYAGALTGPPVLGWIADVTSIQTALIIVTGLIGLIVLFAPALNRNAESTPVVVPLPNQANFH